MLICTWLLSADKKCLADPKAVAPVSVCSANQSSPQCCLYFPYHLSPSNGKSFSLPPKFTFNVNLPLIAPLTCPLRGSLIMATCGVLWLATSSQVQTPQRRIIKRISKSQTASSWQKRERESLPVSGSRDSCWMMLFRLRQASLSFLLQWGLFVLHGKWLSMAPVATNSAVVVWTEVWLNFGNLALWWFSLHFGHSGRGERYSYS